MNDYKEKYNKRKEEILELLKVTKEFYYKYDKNHECNVYESLINNLKNEEFSIVLVGEFSSGKSTFLNALMGEKILPSFTDETTATVNFLRHKEKSENGEAGRVYFKDENGQHVEILEKSDFDTISKYVCTKSDIGVASTIDHVDLFLESKFLEGNVTLVDSPGLNGTADGHREITETQIEKSSASIFMFKADQPGSKTDFDFLRELKNKVNTIIFVLNKIDDIKVSEGETTESVIKSLKDSYKRQFPEETTIPEIWGVSAYQALVARSRQNLDYHDRSNYSKEEKDILEEKSRMKEFENRLWRFLTQGEKARTLLLSPVEKIINDCKILKDSAEDKIKILKTKNDTSEVEEKIIKIREEINNFKSVIKENNNEISNKVRIAIQEIEDLFKVKVENLKEKYSNKIYNWDDIEELIYLEENIDKKINNDYKKIIKECKEDFIEKIQDIIDCNYSEIAEEINNNLDKEDIKISIDTRYEMTKENFNLGIKEYEEEIKKLESEFDNKSKEVYSLDNSIIEKKVKIKKMEKIEEEIQKLKNTKMEYETQFAPTAQYGSENYYDYSERKGLFGKLKNIVFGDEKLEKHRPIILNKEEIEEFKRYKKMNIDNLNNEIANRKEKINEFEKDGIEENLSKMELKYKKTMEEQKQIEKKIEEKQKKFKEKYIKENKKLLRRKKEELEDYFDEINEEFFEKVLKELKKKKDIYIGIIKREVTNNLNIKLEDKNKEYKILENKLKSSQDDKEKYMKNLQNMISDIEKILVKAIELESEIKSQEVDKIKQEAIE